MNLKRGTLPPPIRERLNFSRSSKTKKYTGRDVTRSTSRKKSKETKGEQRLALEEETREIRDDRHYARGTSISPGMRDVIKNKCKTGAAARILARVISIACADS